MPMMANRVKKKVIPKKSISKVLDFAFYSIPNIIVLGDKKIHSQLKGFESFFNLKILTTDTDSLLQTVNRRTVAIVLDESKIEKYPKKYVEIILKQYKYLPVYLLSRSKRANNYYLELYGLGLEGVINWPEESFVLPELLIESLKPHPKANGENKSDEKLANIIKSHLMLIGNYRNTRVKVINGFVFLKGNVKTLWDKKKIDNETQRILGVNKTIIKDLNVKKNKKTSDKEIERKIKIYIGNILGKNKRSIGVKVKESVVQLKGSSSYKNVIQSIEDFCTKQVGVLGLENNIKYRPEESKKNVDKAKVVERKVKEIFDGVRHISIRIYGQIGEISGVVDIPADRALIAKYSLQSLPVNKIINKLVIV